MRWWVGLLVFGPPAFVLGVVLGRLSEIHKEFTMTALEKMRAWYDRWVLALFGILALTATAGILLATNATLQNSRDLVTNCQNSNESRQAARALWGYIVDLSEARNPDASAHDKRVTQDFRDYVNAVYAPRDCSDLSRKYPLPDPPEVVEPGRGR